MLGGIAWLAGFSIFKFIKYIKEELLIVLGTSSSESVLPRMIAKLENLGCKQSVVGLVVPTGYSFNLDGTCIYLTMAAIFLAQATNTELTLWQQLGIIGDAAADLEGRRRRHRLAASSCWRRRSPSVGTIPVASIALILGVDRFMSEARALTNLVGNGVATVVDRQVGEFARRGPHAPRARSRDRGRGLRARGRDGPARSVAAAGNAVLELRGRHADRAIWRCRRPRRAARRDGASRAAEPHWPDHLTIGTASPGGTYYVYGEGLAKILTRASTCRW